nr:MAG TPA: hypothetical protein [Caudoviricetes sp.]
MRSHSGSNPLGAAAPRSPSGNLSRRRLSL